MSTTIGINDSKFVIFGSGHDYTLADSGKGDVNFFSHPKVPLNSVNYASQYKFFVPDENGEFFDAVQDDMAHCTFTPALNTAFTTTGEVQVKVKYLRDYVYPEETIRVEKELTQTIEVVDHGNVVNTYLSKYTLYDDGYLFLHSQEINTLPVNLRFCYRPSSYTYKTMIRKVSCIPWRTKLLGRTSGGYDEGFLPGMTNLTDISELETADVSEVTDFRYAFNDCYKIADFDPLSGWDVSSGTNFTAMFRDTSPSNLDFVKDWDISSAEYINVMFAALHQNDSGSTDISGLAGWEVGHIENMPGLFVLAKITSLHGLENWDVSKAKSLSGMFSECHLSDLSPISGWNTESNTSLSSTFYRNDMINVSALSGWDTSKVTTMASCFEECTNLYSLVGLSGWNTSACTVFKDMFKLDYTNLTDITGLGNWNVSNGVDFSSMFGLTIIDDLSVISGWNMSSAQDVNRMFASVMNIDTIADLTDWRLPSATNLTNMFTNSQKYWSSLLGRPVYESGGMYWDDYNDRYTYGEVQDLQHPLQAMMRDATYAQNWGVTVSGQNAFSVNVWENLPTWN